MIKCKTCGATLQIDQPYCPYCANPNPYFIQHRADMDAYKEEFFETQEDVISHTRKFTGTTAGIAVISVLVVLNLLVFALTTQVWNITDWMEERAIERDYAQHKAVLDQMEQDCEFLAMDGYYYNNGLYFSEKLKEYDAVTRAAGYYTSVYHAVMELHAQGYYDEESYERQLEYIADGVKGLYDTSVIDEYRDPLAYAQPHMDAMLHMQDQVCALLGSYADFSDELLEELDTMGKAKMMVAVEEGMPYVAEEE